MKREYMSEFKKNVFEPRDTSIVFLFNASASSSAS